MTTTISAEKHDIILTNDLSKDFSAKVSASVFEKSVFYVIADETTHKHCFPLLKPLLPANTKVIEIKSGEHNKNLDACQEVWKELLQSGADRNSVTINLGGGMVSDIGGFIAATYKRGIKFINIPTSLLGMVDASCGGKTGIDLESFKNMVGVFAFPHIVIIDPVFLKTLPAKELKSGMAEVLKHAIIADEVFWNELLPIVEVQNVQNAILQNATSILQKSVRIKADIVSKDPFEKNERKFLNFGHTVGHALETHSLKNDKNPLSHGEAIAIGMICEIFLSSKLCGLPSDKRDSINKVIKKLFPLDKIEKKNFDEIIKFINADKKAESGQITYALISAIGKPVLFSGVDEASLIESFHFYNEL